MCTWPSQQTLGKGEESQASLRHGGRRAAPENAARWTDTSTDPKAFTLSSVTAHVTRWSAESATSVQMTPRHPRDWRDALVKAEREKTHVDHHNCPTDKLLVNWHGSKRITSANNWQRSYSTERFNWETPSQANMQIQNINKCKPWLFWNKHQSAAGDGPEDTQRNQSGSTLKSHPPPWAVHKELNEQTAGKATCSQVLGILGVSAQKTLSHRCRLSF